MTEHRIVTTKQADADISAATNDYISQSEAGTVLRFVDELQHSQRVLKRHPQLGSIRFATDLNIRGLRSLPLQGSPYLMFYTLSKDVVYIHRVLHTGHDIPKKILEH